MSLEKKESRMEHTEEKDAFIQDNDPENFEEIRKHFQQTKQPSLRSSSELRIEMETMKEDSKNLQSYMDLSSDSKHFNDDMNVYRSTTKKTSKWKEKWRPYMFQVLTAVAISSGSLVVGYCTAYTSPALVTLLNEKTFNVTRYQGSWVGGIMPLAALIGSSFGGRLIEKFGRRTSILGITIQFILSWLFIAMANSISMIYVGRILSGLSVGIGSLTFPIYLSETLKSDVRGRLGLLPTLFGNLGILICFIAGTYLQWSELAWLGVILTIPCLVLTYLIPETPFWLVKRDEKKAIKALRWFSGKQDVDDEFINIKESQTEESNVATGFQFRELMRKEYALAIGISLGLMFFQQLSGINAVIFYTVTIFRDAGSTIDENVCTIIVGIINLLSTSIARHLIERLGRKILLYASSLVMITTLMCLGTFFYLKSISYDLSDLGWVPLVSFGLYIMGFSLGFGPIPWLMMGEILPLKIKGRAASLVTSFNWTCTFLVTTFFGSLVDSIGNSFTFWLFGIICIFGLIFTIRLVPETKGKSLQEIAIELSR